jgi:hypothetical protein
MRRFWILLACLVFAVTAALYVTLGSEQAAAEPAIPAVLKLSGQYPVIELGEGHWSRPAGDFYQALVRAPGFAEHINTIVLECGNSRYQATLDRYINGEDISFDEISHLWRDTTKVASWESPIYSDLIAAVREVNRGLSAAQRIRVVAADAPIDWGKVRTHGDWESALGSNQLFASIIEREVLAKNRKALVIMGANHVTRGKGWHGETSVTTLLEKRAPRSVYVVLLWGLDAKSDPAVTASPAPVLYPLAGTKLGKTNYFGHRAQDVADAFLYLGNSGGLALPNWTELQNDKAYWTELQRRHQIEFGCPLDPVRWNRQERPCP